MADQAREHLEEELRRLNRDRGELTEQLGVVSRQKSALAEELINARKDLEGQSDTILRLAKEKEELTKDRAELVVQVNGYERENRQLNEVFVFNSFNVTPGLLLFLRSTQIFGFIFLDGASAQTLFDGLSP